MIDSAADTMFWVALGQIIVIDVLLSGDNAVVIALASRALPPRQRMQAIVFGTVGAVVLRVVLTFFAAVLMSQPYLKLAGGALLLWIGITLLAPDDDGAAIDAQPSLTRAIRTIIVADFVMSLDNVIGVAAAAKGHLVLLALGLAISIPLIVYGSRIILRIMDRFPIIITAGAGLLGWIAVETMLGDPALSAYLPAHADWLHYAAPAAGAAVVITAGRMMARRVARQHSTDPVVADVRRDPQSPLS